jgi:hypothetical protein
MNKFKIKIVKISCDLRCLIFCQFIGNEKRKTADEVEYANYSQLSFKVKNKNVTMNQVINLKMFDF